MKNETLSDKKMKSEGYPEPDGYYLEEDVKEFIKEVTEDLERLFYDKNITWATWKRQLRINIKRLAGEKLI